MTGSPIDATNPKHVVVAEVADSDESITAVEKAINGMEIDIKE